MGRELREVKSDWIHPKDDRGKYKPLLDGSMYEYRKEDWLESLKELGLQGVIDEEGDPPNIEDYMPIWSEEEKTHIQMYEDTSEGTPISPLFKKGEEEKLAEWLEESKASWFGDTPAPKKHWLNIMDGGFSGLIVNIPKQIGDNNESK